MQYSQSVRVNQLILTTTPLHTHTETAQFRPTHPTNQCIRTFPYFSRPNVSNQIACNDNSGGYVANHRDRAGGSWSRRVVSICKLGLEHSNQRCSPSLTPSDPGTTPHTQVFSLQHEMRCQKDVPVRCCLCLQLSSLLPSLAVV